MYYYRGRKGVKAQEFLQDLESASREAVVRIRDFFENLESDEGSRPTETSSAEREAEYVTVGRPRADLVETDDTFMARVELPGMTKEKIEVIWRGEGEIVIKGDRVSEVPEGGTILSSTRAYGPFEHVIRLPHTARVNEEGISARHVDGVLTISIEKVGGGGATIEVE